MRQYLNAVENILENGVDVTDEHGYRTRVVFGETLLHFDLRRGFPAVTTKKLLFDKMAGELLWFIEGSSDENRLRELSDVPEGGWTIWTPNANADYWKPKAQFEGDLGRIYGIQWRAWQTPDGREVDQLGDFVERIRTNPYSRRNIVSAWNAGELDQMSLVPCHVAFHAFVNPEDNTLSISMWQRSADMFLGVPFNIASYALLTHMVAQVVGLKPGKIHLWLTNAHVYMDHAEQVELQLSREPYDSPELWLNPDIKRLEDFTLDDMELVGYESHPWIKAPLLVAKSGR